MVSMSAQHKAKISKALKKYHACASKSGCKKAKVKVIKPKKKKVAKSKQAGYKKKVARRRKLKRQLQNLLKKGMGQEWTPKRESAMKKRASRIEAMIKKTY